VNSDPILPPYNLLMRCHFEAIRVQNRVEVQLPPGTVDEFRERSPSFYLATTNAILATIGLAILIYGVLVSL
jgi:hypothetical protein